MTSRSATASHRATIRDYQPFSLAQIDEMMYNDVFEVRDRIMPYGASMVMNLDETPIRPIGTAIGPVLGRVVIQGLGNLLLTSP